MLIRFWVEGYRCFRERVQIDLTDKKNYRFGKECVRGDFLDKMILMGGNGAGKTAFGFAIVDIISTVGGFTNDVGQRNPDCFLNKDSGTDRATFHYELAHKGSVITLEYSLKGPGELVSEELTVDKQTLYRYDLTDGSEPFFDLEALGLKEGPELGRGQSVILYMSRERRFEPDSPVGVVLHFAYHSLYFMAMWMKDVHIGIIEDEDDIEGYIVGNGLVGEFNAFLGEIGSIDVVLSGREGRLYVVKENGEFPYRSCASRGMMILCRLYCWVRRCRDRDALIYFDDFDNMFHYRTAERAIKWILTESKAQCIFVTHNTGLASNDFLRPDCCFLMDSGRLNSFSSLTDKDIRRGHNLEKMLREGEFDRPAN